jgi:alpha-beta hydrolase superfamily lysophospholipase
MASTSETFRAPDGLTLSRRRWDGRDPWAVVLLVHGLAEHSGRYEHVGSHLAERGIEAIAADIRGFGRSGGPRAWVDRWSRLYDDLGAQVREARGRHPGLPLALYGHSLGGMLVLGYVLDGRAAPDLLVLSAPALEADVPAWKRMIAPVLDRVAPRMMIANGLRDRDLSRDPQVAESYRSDPLNVHSSTAHLGAEVFAEQRRVRERLDRLAVPTLVIHGGDDALVPTGSSAVLEGRPGVIRHVYAGVRHELHNEPEHERVLDDVVRWLREHAPTEAFSGR